MDKNGIGDKVEFLLKLSKIGRYEKEELDEVVSYTSLYSENLILGKVFGYSVSDYAFATLFWLNTPETIKLYNDLSRDIDVKRKKEIESLIELRLFEHC